MKRVLIIEDDLDQARLAARLLRAREFEVAIEATGTSGLSAARVSPPDLILLDLILPDLDGYEVCRRLRQDEATRSVPIVLVTALGEDSHRCRGFRVGANAHVSKPYAPADLHNAIEIAFRWKRSLHRAHLRGEIEVELNSIPALLQEATTFFETLSRQTPLAPEQINQLQHALMEIGQNAIEWGNQRCESELVHITYRILEDRIEIIVRDKGCGFDPRNLPHAASDEDPLSHMAVRECMGLRDGGFGLLIARGLLDELRHNERGNEVVLVKRFPSCRVAGPSVP
jgi:DNA-binding response OmpR family regulator